MLWCTFLLSVSYLSRGAVAHGGRIALFGIGEIARDLVSRGSELYSEGIHARDLGPKVGPFSLHERATNQPCGWGNGSCPTGYCCSIGGYCGKGFHYCSGPACQLNYGDACDANTSPTGESTKSVERPLIGNVTYDGAGIYHCNDPNTVAITFDDGPYIFTETILDILDQYNAKATFFVTGNNMGKGQIDDATTGYPQLLQRMYQSGHQIASHTWTHENLTNMTTQQKENQMIYNEMAFRNVLGLFPTYMRPPYSECDNDTQEVLHNLGYHITYYNIDSQDYANDNPRLIQNSKDDINQQFATVNVSDGYPADFIIINHDIHNQTAHNLTQWTLERMQQLGFGTSVTVGECLGDPPENWYRAASGAVKDAPVNQTSLPNATPTAIPQIGASAKSTVAPSLTSLRGLIFGIVFVIVIMQLGL